MRPAGNPVLISSSSNPLIKQIRRLRQRKERQESGLFLVEGLHLVGEALEAGWPVEALVYAPELLTSDYGRRLIDKQSRQGKRFVAVSAPLFTSLTEKENPQGILALAQRRGLVLDHLSPMNFRWGAAIVAPQDPGNVGTVLRTLDAVGAEGLFLLEGGVDPYHPSAVRASMGTIFWQKIISTSFASFLTWARHHRYRLIGSSAHATTDYRSLRRDGNPTVVLLGNEQKGLSNEHQQVCDVVVAIPMRGRASSLNLAIAAGLLLYQLQPE